MSADIPFACSYEFDGKPYAIVIWASIWEEAEMKLKAISKGKIDGVLRGNIKADGDDDIGAIP